MKAKLTTEFVAKLQPDPAGNYRVIDEVTQGFGVVVTPAGAKSYVITYRIGAKKRQATVARCDALSCERARKKAKAMMAAVIDRGEDPLAERHKERIASTLGNYWLEVYLPDAQARWKPTTKATNTWTWNKLVCPRLGKHHLAALSPSVVGAWFRELAPTPGQANIALRLLRAVINHAIANEEIPGPSPAARVKPYPTKPRERFLTAEEFRALWDAIGAEEDFGGKKAVRRAGEALKGQRGGKGLKEIESRGITPHAAGLFRLLMVTGARLREIMHSRWDMVRWDERVLALPDSKTGAKRLPLSAPALAELVRLGNLRTVGNPFIIEGTETGRPLVNATKPWSRVKVTAFRILNERRREAGLEIIAENPFCNVRLHDLRHSFASVAVAAGMGLPIVGKALGHAQARTTERYAHLADAAVLEAVDAIAARILEHATGCGAIVEDIAKTKEA